MWKLRNELVNELVVTILTSCLLHELRDTKLSYLSKDKKDKKIGYIAVCIKGWSIKVCNKYLFWRGSKGVLIPLRGSPF